MRKAMRGALAAGVFAAVLIPGVASAGGGCAHGTPATTAKGVAVEIKDACFYPTVLWVAPGKTVTWINRDEMQHTVTATGFVFNSGDMNRGDRYSFKFLRAGIFAYACIYHPGMVGAVVVGTPVAPKAVSNVALPGDGEGNYQPASAPKAESATNITPTSTKKETDVATTASLTAIAAAVMGSIGYAFGRRRRPNEQ